MEMKTIGTIAYMLVMVFYGLFTMIVSIQAYTKFSKTSQNYDNIVSNLKQIPLIDVQNVHAGACPSGYTSLFLWNWSGMSAGCNCASSSSAKVSKTMYPGLCNANLTSFGCSPVNAIPATPFNYFEGTSGNKMNICVQRASSQYTFYKIASQLNGICPATQKQCGNPAKPMSVYCVAPSDPCPVYDIQVSATINNAAYPGYTMITLDNGKYLYVDKQGTFAQQGPLSELRLTQGPGVCALNNNQMNLPGVETDYVLSLSNRTSCSGYDNTFVQSGFQIAENKYYQLNMNSADYTRMASYPQMQYTTSTTPYNTYQRQFLNWAIGDRDLMYNFVSASDSLNNLKSAQLTVMIINIFVCIMVSIVLQVSQIYNLMGKDVPCIDGKGDEEQQKIVRIKKWIGYGSKLLQTPFLLWAFIVAAQKRGMIKNVANAAPMDPTFNLQISAFATQIEDDVFKKDLAALIVLGVTILLDIVLWLRSKYCAKKDTNSVQPAKIDEEKPVNRSQMPMNTQDPQFQQQQQIQMTPFPPNGVPPQQQYGQPMDPMYQQQQFQQPYQQPYQQQPYQQQPYQQVAQPIGYVPVQQQLVQPVYVQPVVQPVVVVAQPMY